LTVEFSTVVQLRADPGGSGRMRRILGKAAAAGGLRMNTMTRMAAWNAREEVISR